MLLYHLTICMRNQPDLMLVTTVSTQLVLLAWRHAEGRILVWSDSFDAVQKNCKVNWLGMCIQNMVTALEWKAVVAYNLDVRIIELWKAWSSAFFFFTTQRKQLWVMSDPVLKTLRVLAECNTAAVQHDAEMGLWEHKGFPYSQGAQLLAALALISSKAAASS